MNKLYWFISEVIIISILQSSLTLRKSWPSTRHQFHALALIVTLLEKTVKLTTPRMSALTKRLHVTLRSKLSLTTLRRRLIMARNSHCWKMSRTREMSQQWPLTPKRYVKYQELMKKNFPHWPQVRFLSLVILACAEFLGGCTLSVLAPFYSKVEPSLEIWFTEIQDECNWFKSCIS